MSLALKLDDNKEIVKLRNLEVETQQLFAANQTTDSMLIQGLSYMF